jgi:hypothetical protein
VKIGGYFRGVKCNFPNFLKILCSSRKSIEGLLWIIYFHSLVSLFSCFALFLFFVF